MMLALILALVVSEPTEFPGVTCGERCIYGTLGSLSQDVTLKEVQDEYSGRSLGSYCSLADLAVILDYFGVHSAPVSVPDKDIGLVPVGSILHLNGAAEHFVIYGGTENGNIVLLDLPLPATMVSEVDFFPNGAETLSLLPVTKQSWRQSWQLWIETAESSVYFAGYR